MVRVLCEQLERCTRTVGCVVRPEKLPGCKRLNRCKEMNNSFWSGLSAMAGSVVDVSAPETNSQIALREDAGRLPCVGCDYYVSPVAQYQLIN